MNDNMKAEKSVMEMDVENMTQIKVSVVMPIYNAEAFLDKTLEDVSGQTLRDIEIICVDDGSTDSSRHIVENWQKTDPRIMLLKQHNQYAGVARNHGLAHASGKYVVFWDADDMFHKDALEKLYNRAEETQADLCLCAAEKFDTAAEKYIYTEEYLRKEYLPDKEVFNKHDIPNYIFNIATNVPWNKMFLRSFVKTHQLRFQAVRQANDTFFSIMAYYFAERIAYVDEALITYRINNTTSLSGKASNTLFCAYDSYVYTQEYLQKQSEYKMVKTGFRNRVLSGLFHSLNIQNEFEAYHALYEKIVQDGIQRFELDQLSEDDAYAAWAYRDLKKITELSAEEFLMQKAYERWVHVDKLKSRNKVLKQRAENTIAAIRASKTFKAGTYVMWLPRKMKAFFTKQ